MNYSTYLPVDVVNGVGTRCTLFVSGCNHKCDGCYNEHTWNKNFGHTFTKDLEDKIIEDLKNDFIPLDGLSLSGGDPLFSSNVPFILNLVKRVKQECPTKTIWLWSGYTLQELKDNQSKSNIDEARHEIMKYIDVFIDGKFEKEHADPTLYWRGSSNQIIHHFER